MRQAGQDPGILVEIDLLRPMRGSVGKFPVSVRRRGGHDEECDQGKRCPMRGYPQDESLPSLCTCGAQPIKTEPFSIVRQAPNTCKSRGKNTQARRSADKESDQD